MDSGRNSTWRRVTCFCRGSVTTPAMLRQGGQRRGRGLRDRLGVAGGLLHQLALQRAHFGTPPAAAICTSVSTKKR